jgi:hypothetical protein
MGGYSMSTQSTTVPGVTRLVGTTTPAVGATVGAALGVAVGAAVGAGVAAGVGAFVGVAAGEPVHATRISTAAAELTT